jgi:DNA-binding CsgD family transcriptional regulator
MTRLVATGLSNEAIGEQFDISRERVRIILDAAKRDGRKQRAG